MRKKIFFSLLVLSLLVFTFSLLVVYAQVDTKVNIQGGKKFYGDNCTNDSECVSDLCLYGACACITDHDCVYGGRCIGNQCAGSLLWSKSSLYTPGAVAKIIGDLFSYDGTLNFSIINSTGSIIYGPKLISLNSTGGFFELWNTSGFPLGNYTVVAVDLNDSFYNNSLNITLLPPYMWTGRVFDAFNLTVNSSVIVTDDNNNVWQIDDTYYNLTLYYGIEYDVNITISQTHPIRRFIFHFVLNDGFEGDILGIDNVPLSNSNFTDFRQIVAFIPVVSGYQYSRIFFSHPVTIFADRLYKCESWDFFNRTCQNDSDWKNMVNYTSGQSSTEIIMYPGDPGLGVGKDFSIFCGNNICDFDESCSLCPQDCGGCTPTPPSGGGTFDSIPDRPCDYDWQCSAWSICSEEGIKTRSCTNVGTCEDSYNPPDEERSCRYEAKCDDDMQNGAESDVDCGGNCKKCEDREDCNFNNDCKSGYCFMNTCRKSDCSDRIQNQGEQGVDCGGPCKPCGKAHYPSPTDGLPGLYGKAITFMGKPANYLYLLFLLLFLIGILFYGILARQKGVYAIKVPYDKKMFIRKVIKFNIHHHDLDTRVFSYYSIKDYLFVEANSKKKLDISLDNTPYIIEIAPRSISLNNFYENWKKLKDKKIAKEKVIKLFYPK